MNNQNGNTRNQVTYHILENYGVLMKYDTGWTKELNLVSWNDTKPKYDIRDWNPEHDRMSKGVTLHHDELEELVRICGEKILTEEE